jgi:GNAT superfamily N-acetyltransferase
MTLVARGARTEDYADFARMFLELRVPDPTPSAEKYEAQIRPHAFFLWEGETPVAYAYWQAVGELARLIHVTVDAPAQGRGVGGALMREIGARAKRAGCVRWMLNVKPGNVPAVRLYQRHGLKAVARGRAMDIAWTDVERLPRGENEGETEVFVVAAEEEARVEIATRLPAGLIAVLRAGERALLALRWRNREGEIVGFAAFDPSYPGAMPFVAERPWIARRLLDAMRPYALAEHAKVRFFAGNDEVWREAESAGAWVALETMRMEGEIG